MKLFAISFIFLSFIGIPRAAACGGCVDAPLAMAGAQTIMRTYDAGDKIVAQAIDTLIDKVNHVMQQEVLNHKKYTESTRFSIDAIAHLKKITFLHDSNMHMLVIGDVNND